MLATIFNIVKKDKERLYKDYLLELRNLLYLYKRY